MADPNTTLGHKRAAVRAIAWLGAGAKGVHVFVGEPLSDVTVAYELALARNKQRLVRA